MPYVLVILVVVVILGLTPSDFFQTEKICCELNLGFKTKLPI